MRKRGIIIVMLSSILICLVSILCTYFGLLAIGVIPQDKIELSYEVLDTEKEYDGTALYAQEYELKSGELMAGHMAVFHPLSSQTEIGSTDILAQISIENELGDDVSEYYTIRYDLGSITVTPRVLEIKIPSTKDLSDSSLLTKEQYEVVSGSLMVGHQLYAEIDESIADGQATFTPSLYILDAEGLDVTSNYTISTTFENQTIDLLSLSIKPADISIEYSREEIQPKSVEIVDGVLKPGHYIVSEFVSPSALDIGVYQTQIASYKIYDIYHEDVTKLYDVSTLPGSINITKRHLTITTSSFSSQYKGIGISTDERVAPSIEGLLDGDSISYVYNTGIILINCGVYRNSIEADNVHITHAAQDVTDVYDIQIVEGEITITPAPIDIVWHSLELSYSAVKQFPAYELAGVLEMDIENVDLIYYSMINAGSYNAAISLDNSNYYLQEDSVTYSILPAPVDISSQSTSLMYTGGYQRPQISILGLYIQDEGMCNASIEANKDCGEYEVEVALDNPNYYPSRDTITYTISPYEIECVWTEAVLAYTGSPQAPKLENEGTYPIIYEGYGINAGQYSVKAFLQDSNYVLINNTTVFTINPKTITASFGATSLVYNGKNQAPEVTINDLCPGDVCTYSLNQQRDVGNYSINLQIYNDNYVLSSSNTKSYAIVKREISVMAITLTKTDDGMPLYGQYAVISGSLAEGDSIIAYDTTYNYLDGVGSIVYSGYDALFYGYNSSGKLIDVSKNYSIVEGIDGTLTIL